MATRRSNKLVGQTGEYLVAAELSRRGLIATTFTGNAPHFDIIASNESGRHVFVQVKTARGSSWQFGDIRKSCKLEFDGERQVVGEPKPAPVRRLVMVFVKLGDDGSDRYYILTWEKLRDVIVKKHCAYLQRHKGIRPNRWDSLHSAVKEERLAAFRDNWQAVEKSLR